MGYDYCLKKTCHKKHFQGMAITTVGVNKSADAIVVGTPDEIARRGASGEFGKKGTGLGIGYRSPTGRQPVVRRGPVSRPVQPRKPWTEQQENAVRLYREMNLSPREIVERAAATMPRLRLTQHLVVQILGTLPRRRPA